VSQKISKTNPLTHYKGERDGCTDCRKGGGIVARTDADMFQLSRHTHTQLPANRWVSVCVSDLHVLSSCLGTVCEK